MSHRRRAALRSRQPALAPGSDTAPEWRRRAVALLRSLHKNLIPALAEENSPYTAFRELVPLCAACHREGRAEDLAAIYAFVDWCFKAASEGGHDLANAAGVAFLEHLSQHGVAPDEVLPWLAPDVAASAAGLWRGTEGD
jgi:hypothetical protein